MLLQHGERHDVQDALVGGCEYHVGRGTIVVGPEPVYRGYAPAIPGYQAREAILRSWSDEIVADIALMFEEVGCYHGTDSVATQIFRSGGTASIPVEAGERIGAARLKFTTQHVEFAHP